jgi:hypothetical protein
MDGSESSGLLKNRGGSSDKEHQYGATYRVKPTKEEKVCASQLRSVYIGAAHHMSCEF